MAGTKTVPLSKGMSTLIDSDDYPLVSQLKTLYYSNDGYAKTRVDGKLQGLHRVINKTPEGLWTDHINRNKLDNRKSNLRSVTPQENALNGCGRKHWKYDLPRGITFDKSRNQYVLHKPTRRFNTLAEAKEAI